MFDAQWAIDNPPKSLHWRHSPSRFRKRGWRMDGNDAIRTQENDGGVCWCANHLGHGESNGGSGWKADSNGQTSTLEEEILKEHDWANNDGRPMQWGQKRGEPGNPPGENRWRNNEWWRNERNSQTTEWAPSQDAREDTRAKEVTLRLSDTWASRKDDDETNRVYTTWTRTTRAEQAVKPADQGGRTPHRKNEKGKSR